MKQQRPKDYFEGILQIRNGSEEMLMWVHDRIKKEGKAAVAKEKRVRNGVDLYITDQHYLQNLGRKLRERFQGILKTSKRLHTTDKMTSKLLYRVTVLFKPFPFKRGDIITFHGEQVEIVRLANRVTVKDIKSGQKKEVDPELLLR